MQLILIYSKKKVTKDKKIVISKVTWELEEKTKRI